MAAKPDVKWIGSHVFTSAFFQPLVDRKILTREGAGNFNFKAGITEDDRNFISVLKDELLKSIPGDQLVKIKKELDSFMYAISGPKEWARENRGKEIDVARGLRDKLYDVMKEIHHDEKIQEERQDVAAGGGRTYKKGGLLKKGERSVPVPIIAHSGELVVPVDTVDDVLNSNAWKKHVKKIAMKKGVSISEAYKMSLGL